jgi:predicted Zn-dependent protease
MKAFLHTRPAIPIIIMCGFVLPYFFFPSNGFALSIEEERILGQQFLAQIRGRFEIVEDDSATKFINDLGHYLIRPLETKPFPFKFYIIKDNTLNAFAAPGGHIFVFSGLVEALDSVDELAAVMCHEIGHVSARHLAQRIEQDQKINLAALAGILAGVFVGGPAGEAIATGSVAAGLQAQLYYSRNDERQADQLSFKYLKSAGFDPSGMVTSLEKIEKNQWQGVDKVPTYLKTHPSGPERMSNLDTLLSTYTAKSSSKGAEEQFKTLFPYFKTILRAKCLDSHEAERLFDLELKNGAPGTLPHFGLGIIFRERSEYALGIHHFKKALEGAPDSIMILKNLGEAYQMNGQNREAISVLELALKQDADDKSALFLLGLSYENLEQYEKAISIFERLISFKPVENAVYYHLGLSYGRQDKLALAHYNFGLYFKRLGQFQKARFHFRKAHNLSENNPALRKKILKEIEEKPHYGR